MIQALVLIEAEPTRVQELVQELQDLKLDDSIIKHVYGVTGRYDLVALISKGCADGPLDDIAAIMAGLHAGQTLEIHATDASVAVDLAAWCRMTANVLLDQRGSRHLVRRREQPSR